MRRFSRAAGTVDPEADSDDGYLHVSPEAMLRADHTFKPTSQTGSDAYRDGKCKTCHTERHRPGGTECWNCYYIRMTNLGFAPSESENHGES